ncbi:MAG TPA: IS66 family transposase [Candidatus Limnocylindrales bacterium]|nr:IS66 family transposase [Candidatus Limnocylindrales bacterium]
MIPQLLSHIDEQSQHIAQQSRQLDSTRQAIKWRDAKIEKITFELARLKSWRFGASSERMTAQQRELFAEALAADQADLEEQLAALQATSARPEPGEPAAKRKPRREQLPQHLPRVEQRVEPENTTCECGQPMQRVGEDVSERLDIVPAQFFVQRQIRGKWACRCCQLLRQEPAAAQVFDNGLPTPGLQAHSVISRFVDHLPYYRQEQINARSGVHTPRSTLAGWAGRTGAQLMPLFEAHREFVLGSRVLHGDETTVALLDPGAGKTKTAYMWAYARGVFDPHPGVVYDFCTGRGGKFPFEFLHGWTGTLVCDGYAGYDKALLLEDRFDAGCMAHSRRKFDELVKANASPVATQALQRIAWLYRIEADARDLSTEQRLQMRQARSQPLCEELHTWLRLERQRVPDGSAIAKAIDYSLNRWTSLTRFLEDGDVPIDNNHLENQMRPWALGRKNWLFVGSELAGERAAMIMSLLQSAKLNAADPWSYLKDVLTRLPTQLNSRIEELLPHRWKLSS